AATRAAQLGAKTALIEKDRVGGTCLNRGCIPTKAIIAAVNLYEKIRKAEKLGISTGEVSIHLSEVIDRKNEIVSKIVKGVEFLLEKNQVELIRGTGKVLENAGTGLVPVRLEIIDSTGRKSEVVSSKLILATGSSPASLPGINFNGENFLSSNDILNLRTPPEELDIVGGGVIGIHFASIFSTLGTKVRIWEVLPEILPGTDEEITAHLKRILNRKKVEIKTSARFNPAEAYGKSLICVGRTPNLAGLENLNLKMNGKSVWVNEKMETSLPGIWAIGDLVSKKMLAHVAYEQGIIAAENALGGDKTFNDDHIPLTIYTHPEIGSIGLTEKEARENYPAVTVGKHSYRALGIAQAMGELDGLIKLISDDNGKILGVHILGAEASTLIGAAAVAVKNGLTVNQLAETFQSHPSYPEGLQEAALNSLQRSLHSINM
ncbi:dihydrolipoyl dehydrogenase, partial [Candidatus Saganbacteria bacterium]|nr:dihydrolipoyl dehydrogenase [Candidatus Saganbacteria bacterium]